MKWIFLQFLLVQNYFCFLCVYIHCQDRLLNVFSLMTGPTMFTFLPHPIVMLDLFSSFFSSDIVTVSLDTVVIFLCVVASEEPPCDIAKLFSHYLFLVAHFSLAQFEV